MSHFMVYSDKIFLINFGTHFDSRKILFLNYLRIYADKN